MLIINFLSATVKPKITENTPGGGVATATPVEILEPQKPIDIITQEQKYLQSKHIIPIADLSAVGIICL